MAFVIGVCTLKYYGLKDKIKKKISFIYMQKEEQNYYRFCQEREENFGKVIMIIFLNVIIGG